MTAPVSKLTSTTEVTVPSRAIDRVIGQSQAVAMAKLAARQRRFLFLIGEPGTGKSLIGRAMAELLSSAGRGEVTVALPNAGDPMRPQIATMDKATLTSRERAMAALARGRLHTRRMLWIAAMVAWLAISYVAIRQLGLWREWVAATMTGGFCLLVWLMSQRGRSKSRDGLMPRILIPETNGSPFIDATGLTAGALFGDVRHDPYQSGGFETAPHLLIEPGAIHRAHGGVLYIDEISTLSQDDQRLLLTAIQDKALPISGRSSGSSGSLVRTDPVPCDFILVAAGHEDDLEGILPALRSRMRGLGYEVRMASSMAYGEREQLDLVQFIAQEVATDGRIPHFDGSATEAVIREAARMAGSDEEPSALTLRLRELGGLIRLAGDLAVQAGATLVSAQHVQAACALRLPIEDLRYGATEKVASRMVSVNCRPSFGENPRGRDKDADLVMETGTRQRVSEERTHVTSARRGGLV